MKAYKLKIINKSFCRKKKINVQGGWYYLYRMAKENISDQVILAERAEGSKGTSHMDIEGSILAENSNCKDPMVLDVFKDQ